MRPILTPGAAAVPSRGMSRTPRTIAIHKFGGTSLGDASRIRNAARLLAAARRRRPVVAVASAMGGVTDVLLEAARDAERGRLGLARKAGESLSALGGSQKLSLKLMLHGTRDFSHFTYSSNPTGGIHHPGDLFLTGCK